METGYTREYYQKVILSDFIQNFKIYGKPAKSLNEIVVYGNTFGVIGFLSAFLLSNIGIIVGPFPWWFNGILLIFTVSLSLILNTIGIYCIHLSGCYKALEEYFILKEEVINKTCLLEDLVRKDKKTIGVSPSELVNITDTIDLISQIYKKIPYSLWVYKNIFSGKSMFNISGEIYKLIDTEKSWIYNYTVYTNNIIKSWLLAHAEELEKVDTSLQVSSPSSTDERDVLFSASKRLESHIADLEKARVQI